MSNKENTPKGVIIKIIIEINRDVAGEIEKIKILVNSINKRFLLNSFKASLIGWRIPNNLTLFGPFRICI